LGEDALKSAIDLIHAGQRESAQRILQSLLKVDSHNIPAWFWYVETCATAEQRLQILETCAKCNPDNTQVNSVLRALRKSLAPASGQTKSETRPPYDHEPRVEWKATSTTAAPTIQEPVATQPTAELHPQRDVTAKKPRSVGALIIWPMAGVLIAVFALLIYDLIAATPADPAPHRFTQPIEYYLYVPKAYAPTRAWPLFIGIHGSGGTGLDCWNLWQPYAEREGFILLCPTLSDSSGGWFQNAGEANTWAVINQVVGQYKVKPRFFLAGFSAGAQFVQGFCFDYPGAVQAVAVLSAGNYYQPSGASGGIPFLVVIGGSDDPVAINGSVQFAQALAANGSGVSYWLLPGVGHEVTSKTKQLTIDFFRAAYK